MKNKSISVIVPCYNEEQNITRFRTELISIINKLSDDYEIILVDDGSSDNTLKEMKKLKRISKRIKIVIHEKNKGLGSAVRTGIKNATKELLITLDSDLTFHPNQIRNLLNRFNKGDIDCVIGSPNLNKDNKVQLHRMILSKIVNLIYAILLGKHFTSVSPIFRVYKTYQLKKINLNSKGFTINAEILFWLIKNKRKVVEVPAILTVRKFGVSKINTLKEIKNHLKMFYNIILWRLCK